MKINQNEKIEYMINKNNQYNEKIYNTHESSVGINYEFCKALKIKYKKIINEKIEKHKC